jgi:hypothetical protein
MTDLQALFETIDHLQPEEFEQVEQYIKRRSDEHQRHKPTAAEVQAKMAALDAATAALREGLTDEQLEQMTWAMNVEYIVDEDLPGDES